MAHGVHPEKNHNGLPFDENYEEHRIQAAGTPLEMRAVILQIRGDWLEFTERYGFPGHGSGYRPCFLCNAVKANMWDPVGVSLV